MRTIWKYPIGHLSILEIPKGAKFLDAQVQDDKFCLWFEVETEQATEKRTFHLAGTGDRIYAGNYLATFQAPPFVWHVYEGIE